MLKAKNDSPRIKKEFGELRVHNKDLMKLILDLYHWIDDTFGKDTVMTMLYRTDAEQDAIYGINPRYQKKPWKSPHQFYHAVDIRSRIFTEDEIKQIEDYLNSKWNDTNYYKWTAKCHKVTGQAYHFHIQYVRK